MAHGHWLKDYIGPHSGGSGGGTEPLIIHVTEEEVKDSQTQKTIGYKTDVLASDAYEAWQNGRPIYCYVNLGEWLVFRVGRFSATTILVDHNDNDSLTFKTLRSFGDDYLFLEVPVDDDKPIG